jgi:bifunctional non-homologous end joining protein LigD
MAAYCFDLLEIDGRDLRPFPLLTRRVRLKALLKRAGAEQLLYSEAFADPAKLLDACEVQGLEGIVSKRQDQPYVSGRNQSWVKVKCHAWRATAKERSELFRK